MRSGNPSGSLKLLPVMVKTRVAPRFDVEGR
jgi:hypothetical protein